MATRNEEIVISGIAGRYPECDSFDEFKEALFSGKDLITEDSRRFKPGSLGTPKRLGKINNVEKFDASFFGCGAKVANYIDPRHRIMFETVFETIVDSGYNPKELRGSNTGVYVGITNLDAQEYYEKAKEANGYATFGSNMSQIANKTSFHFDFKGPSYVLDTACSTSLTAISNAVNAIENGEIDAAIVSAVSIVYCPHQTKDFVIFNAISMDGKSKVFGKDRDGYVKSEAIVTVFLQKKSACRRLYATILGAGINSDGFKSEGITHPSIEGQTRLIKTLYNLKNLDANEVNYVELHGTGTPVGDAVECQTTVDCFCQNRKSPLLIGSVKSNMGHSEVSAGLCSISKVLIAMESEAIPANIHCENLDYTLPGLDNGKLKVVTEKTPWNGGIVALNNFGIGGSNAHAVLKSNTKLKSQYDKFEHRLVHVSGRTEEGVKYYLDQVNKNQNDQEFLALLDSIHRLNVEGHLYRGYALLGANDLSEISKTDSKGRSIWFIYSGIGSQWTGMGKDLMKLDVFRKTFKKCAKALLPYNVDLEKVILSDDKSLMNNIINCFSAIAAIEVAMTDVLKSLGIVPNNFAGHSVGEAGCAYCNGDLTAEQATLLGYARGYSNIQANCRNDMQMAAVGLSRKECLPLLPEGVYISCVNGLNSVTVGGEKPTVKRFVEVSSKRGIFARLVESAGYAFHTKYIENAVPIFEDFVKEVIPDPKLRSSKWISSSWNEFDIVNNSTARYNSAEYHGNNIKSTVLFDQVIRRIPKNAIVIEVAPHALLTPILKRELGPAVTCLGLANRSSNDNVQFLLSNIGKLFINGGQPDLTTFYNQVSYPVGKGTCNIGSLIKWDHKENWNVPYYDPLSAFGERITVNTQLPNYRYLTGHLVDGDVVMPAMAYLVLVWSVLAETLAKEVSNLPVVFHSVKFLRTNLLLGDEDLVFYINIMRTSGYFEVFHGESVCCTGTIAAPEDISQNFLNLDHKPEIRDHDLQLGKSSIYKLLHLRRLSYSGEFQGLERADLSGSYAEVSWNKSFSAFLDSLFQLARISVDHTDLLLPFKIEKIVVDPIKLLSDISEDSNITWAYYNRNRNVIRSAGVEITNFELTSVPKKGVTQKPPVITRHTFVPYLQNPESITNFRTALNIALEIGFENIKGVNLDVRSNITADENKFIMKTLMEVLADEPYAKVNFVDDTWMNWDCIITDTLDIEVTTLINNCFILYVGTDPGLNSQCELIYSSICETEDNIYLLRYINNTSPTSIIIIVSNSEFGWLEKVKSAIQNKTDVVYLVNNGDDISGSMGLVRSLNLEPILNTWFKCIFIDDPKSESFSLDHPFYAKQVKKNLACNVLRNGVWGSYRYVPLELMKEMKVSSACSIARVPGDLTTMTWIEQSPECERLWNNSQYVYVYYGGITNMAVSEKSHSRNRSREFSPTGIEYAGITKEGKRVMGLSNNTIALQTVTDPIFTWNVPDYWTLEQAASVPSAYIASYYALIDRGRLEGGESILIHAGGRDVGLAAITIALSIYCEVYTTVGSEEEKIFVLELFPKLKSKNIGSYQNGSFEQLIKERTNGKGVNVVFNSLTKDLFQASARCLAYGGRFLDIGDFNSLKDLQIPSGLIAKNSSFHSVHIDALLTDKTEVKQRVCKLLSEGLMKHVVQPLPRSLFEEDQIDDAFKLMSSNKYIGKILIKIRNEDSKTIQSPQRFIPALRRLYFSSIGTYILIGGLGGFGLELTQFLINRGARKIILNSRRGLSNGYQRYCLKKWSLGQDVRVIINTDDTSTLEGARSLVELGKSMGPVKGIFNVSLLLNDALFVNHNIESFKAAFKSKINSGLNMDLLTKKYCPELEHFVMFSSISSGRGNPGQTNYAMANSALERLCERRSSAGLPALAVLFAYIADVGVVVDAQKSNKSFNMFHLETQRIDSCLDVLESFMLQSTTVVSSFVVADKNVDPNATKRSLVETVAQIIGIRNIDTIDVNQSLSKLGLDSLMAGEIQQVMLKTFNINMKILQLRKLTFAALQEMS
ncbi:fatty acid synthase-like [Sitophilus oryzae]|uniref:Fatty acid synthase n=1 Tax=Sitophilus oryzae TaxID=7048 RepID=A0A6J2YJ23_SITOR|nr:fatty acid synthase-like [Sitophilus oryzae]